MAVRERLMAISKYVFIYILTELLCGVALAKPYPGNWEKKDNFVQVSPLNSHYLQYDDGSPYIPVGQNICWSRTTVDPDKALAQYKAYFDKFADNGGNLVRIWLSAPLFEIEQVAPHVYSSAKRDLLIDQVLKLASERGIKIKFCLENFRVLLNRPAPFEGSVPFDKPIYHVKNGGELNNTGEYLTTKAGLDLYIGKMKYFSRKFAANPTIFGWELWNEFNCIDAPDNTTRLEWTEKMLAEAKKCFPDQLVMQTLGSFDSASQRSNYLQFSSLSGNEIAQVHRYMDPAPNKLKAVSAPMDILTSDATRELLAFDLGKPVLLSETGAVEANHAAPSRLYDLDKEGVLLHDLIFAPFFSGAAGSGQCWHWHHYVDRHNLWWHFGRFAAAIRGLNPLKENFKPVFSETGETRNYTLQGVGTTISWLRDVKSDWQSELVEARPAQPLTNLSINVETMGFGADLKSVQCYLPWEDRWVDVAVNNGSLKLPAFKRSVIVKALNH